MSVSFIARDSTLPERGVNAIMFVASALAACMRDVFASGRQLSRTEKRRRNRCSSCRGPDSAYFFFSGSGIVIVAP